HHHPALRLDLLLLPKRLCVPELRPKTGTDPAVAAYIEQDPETARFLARTNEYLDYLLPLYEKEQKSYLSLGVGCTGGKHRSVYIAERLAARLQKKGYPVRVFHRDATRA